MGFKMKSRTINGFYITQDDFDKAWSNGISAQTFKRRLETGNYTIEEATTIRINYYKGVKRKTEKGDEK